MKHVARMAAVLGFLLVAGVAHAAPPVVTSVYPQRQRINANGHTPIEVQFDQEIDPASVTPITFRVFGRWSGPATRASRWRRSHYISAHRRVLRPAQWITVSLSKGHREYRRREPGERLRVEFLDRDGERQHHALL
jgi:hypothetical protein